MSAGAYRRAGRAGIRDRYCRRSGIIHLCDCRSHDSLYTDRMTTTVSFRADDRVVQALDAEATRSGTTKSELLVQAVKELLYRLACERDAQTYARIPLTPQETTGWSNEQWIEDEPGTDWATVFAS